MRRGNGLGRTAPDYRLEGAREVRLAGRAFQAMRYRIMRQLNERTEMLAGVSHVYGHPHSHSSSISSDEREP